MALLRGNVPELLPPPTEYLRLTTIHFAALSGCPKTLSAVVAQMRATGDYEADEVSMTRVLVAAAVTGHDECVHLAAQLVPGLTAKARSIA